MTDDVLIARTEGLIGTEVDGELVALNVASGTCYGFNYPATRIWALLERPMTVTGLCRALADEFDGEESAMEADVRALVEELRSDGLVTVGAAA